MPSIEVTPYPLPDREAMASASFQLNDQGWQSELCYERPPQGGPDPVYYLTLNKAGDSATLYIGDQLVSIGGGVLMTQDKYDALFGGA